MKQPRSQTPTRRGWEMVIFFGASIPGIYGLGRGLTGLFEPGQSVSLVWLAVTGVAVFVLCAQMGRVHDTWPRRRDRKALRPINEERAREASPPPAGK